jgi:hypothetical protein
MKKTMMIVLFIVVLAVIFTIPATLFAEPSFIISPGEGHPAVPANSVGVANSNAKDGLHNAAENVSENPGWAAHVLFFRVSPHATY